MNNTSFTKNAFIKFITICILFLFIFVSCQDSPVSYFTIRPNYDKKFDKILIVGPYTNATEKDRVFVFFGVEEFTKRDEESFYLSLINSLKDSNLFKQVLIMDSWDKVTETRGNIYLGVYNNVASVWYDYKESYWCARFNTTIAFEVKNIVYFSKVYDVIAKNRISPAPAKDEALRTIINQLLEDLKNQTLEKPLTQ